MTLSDHEGNARLLDNLKRSCDLNGLTVDHEASSNGVRIIAISWGVFSPNVIQLEPQDVILASDCFYDTKGHEVYYK